MRALVLKQQGWTQRAIAEALGVSEQAVGQWLTAARLGGPEALRSHPAPGAAPKLTAAQKSPDPGVPVARPRRMVFGETYGPVLALPR